MTLKKHLRYDSKLESLVHTVCPDWELHPPGWEWLSVTHQRIIGKAPLHLQPGMVEALKKKYTPDFITPRGTYVEVKGMLDQGSKSRWSANLRVVHLLSFSKVPAVELVSGYNWSDPMFHQLLLGWYKGTHKSVSGCLKEGLWIPINHKDLSWLHLVKEAL